MEPLREHKAKSKKAIAELTLATYNFKRILNVCEDAINTHKMAAIIGEPGYGKTVALEYFAHTRSKKVYMMTVKPSMAAKHFWSELHESLPEKQPEEIYSPHDNRSMFYVIKKISLYLNARPGGLVIIDEAGKLTSRMLEYVHELRDATRKTTGIILSGPGYFKANILDWVKGNKQGIPEIFRRINHWEELLPPSKAEVKSFCNHFGITDENIVKELTLECKNFGVLQNHIDGLLSRGFRGKATK
jgi:stalled ribosome rescue protein Dom34